MIQQLKYEIIDFIKYNNLMNTKYESFLPYIIGLTIYFILSGAPLDFIIFFIAIFLAVLILVHYFRNNFEQTQYTHAQKIRREAALKKAKIYLAPYKNIWANLKLSNKHCMLILGKDGVSISAEEKIWPYRKFRVVSSNVHNYYDLWNLFCLSFNHCKTYNDLVDNCFLYKATIIGEGIEESKEMFPYTKPAIKEEVKIDKIVLEKIDINNSSEIELTQLPGISIVLAKKIVKKREEIGGFKNINDFFIYMRFKEHIKNQLVDLICVNKMKGSLKKLERNTERSVDL